MLTQVFFVYLCSPLWDDKIYHSQYHFAYPQRFAKKVKKISDDTGLLQAQVFDTILQAGCMALDEIADEDITFPLPLRFQLKKKK